MHPVAPLHVLEHVIAFLLVPAFLCSNELKTKNISIAKIRIRNKFCGLATRESARPGWAGLSRPPPADAKCSSRSPYELDQRLARQILNCRRHRRRLRTGNRASLRTKESKLPSPIDRRMSAISRW